MTSIPTVKALLKTILSELDAQVIYGPRSAVTITKPDVLTIGRVRGNAEFSDLGMSGFTETYTVDMEAMSSRPGVSQQLADEAALATFAEAAALVNAYDFGPQISANVTGDFEMDEQADENGRHSIVRFAVAVFAAN